MEATSSLKIKSGGEITVGKDTISIRDARFVPKWQGHECVICDENSTLVKWTEEDKIQSALFLPNIELTINMVSQFTTLILSEIQCRTVNISLFENARIEIVNCSLLQLVCIHHHGTEFTTTLHNYGQEKYKGKTLRRGTLAVHKIPGRTGTHNLLPAYIPPM